MTPQRGPATGWAGLALAVLVLFLGASCGDPTTRRTRPQLLPPLAALDFGAVPVLNERQLELPLLNVGRAVLTVSNVQVQGEGFTLRSAPDTLVTGQELPVVVAFTPSAEAAYQGTLTFETDDVDNALVTVSLAGTGSTRAVMEVSPASMDFGRVSECSAAVKTFTIVSKGTADLVVNDISFVDGTDPAFSFVGSTRTPAVVKAVGPNGLPGQIQLTVKVTAKEGEAGPFEGGIRIRGTDPDQQEVVVPLHADVNRAPVAVITPLGNGAPGMQVDLDGTGSTDADADLPLTYKWTLRSKPLSATTAIVGPEQPVTRMTLDALLPGAYEVQLDVTDAAGAKACRPARASIVATPAQKLLVEMFWDNSETDIDLHVLRTPDAKMGQAPDDCHYANPTPDWGNPSATSDDPTFIRDALTGYGPELFGYADPASNTYRLAVEFANEHLSANPASNVTVRVYLYGVVKGEFTRRLTQTGMRWAVADVEWPSGTVTALP